MELLASQYIPFHFGVADQRFKCQCGHIDCSRSLLTLKSQLLSKAIPKCWRNMHLSACSIAKDVQCFALYGNLNRCLGGGAFMLEKKGERNDKRVVNVFL